MSLKGRKGVVYRGHTYIAYKYVCLAVKALCCIKKGCFAGYFSSM